MNNYWMNFISVTTKPPELLNLPILHKLNITQNMCHLVLEFRNSNLDQIINEESSLVISMNPL